MLFEPPSQAKQRCGTIAPRSQHITPRRKARRLHTQVAPFVNLEHVHIKARGVMNYPRALIPGYGWRVELEVGSILLCVQEEVLHNITVIITWRPQSSAAVLTFQWSEQDQQG